MTNNHQPVRVTRTDKQRSPERARRLGKALIALARAQLEAEAQAQTPAGTTGDKQPGQTPASPDLGDAA